MASAHTALLLEDEHFVKWCFFSLQDLARGKPNQHLSACGRQITWHLVVTFKCTHIHSSLFEGICLLIQGACSIAIVPRS